MAMKNIVVWSTDLLDVQRSILSLSKQYNISNYNRDSLQSIIEVGAAILSVNFS